MTRKGGCLQRFRKCLRDGAPILAVNVGGPCAALARPLAAAGATLFVDCERTAIGIGAVPGLVAAAHVAGGLVMLRSESADPATVTRYLDCGIDALVVPLVESAAACAKIVATAQAQGLGAARAAIIVQIESVAGLAAAEAIAGTDGVDAVLLGPNDLAVSMGHPGEPGHPLVQEALSDTAASLRAARMPFGLPVTPATLPGWAARGASLFYIPAGDFVAAALAPYKEALNGN
jgi:4-hydroxy-2-oxoheptanedioate aldolase